MFISCAVIIIVAKVVISWVFVIKFGKPSSKQFFIFEGIHSKRLIPFFIHYMLYRLGLAILVGVVGANQHNSTNIKVCVLLLVGLQVFSTLFNLIKLYST